MKQCHAEIQYTNSEGKSIHSDICPPRCNFERIDEVVSEEGETEETYRQLLHKCLDEWLDNSNGTGEFYIGGKTKTWQLIRK